MWEPSFAKVRGNIKPLQSSYDPGFHFLPSRFSLSLKYIPSSLQTMPTKVVTLSELREHATKDNIWVLLHSKGQSSHYQ